MSSQSPDSIFTSIPTDMALRQAEIAALRSLESSVSSLDRRLEGFGNTLTEVRDKVITLEAERHDTKLTEMREDFNARLKFAQELAMKREERLQAVERMLARHSLALVGIAAVASASLTLILNKFFGG